MSSTKEDRKPEIECSRDGPYVVKTLEQLVNSQGEEIPTKKIIALCRCGSSSNKPFCDGTHAKIGFSSKKLTDGSWNKRENYVGGDITIHDNRGICAHIGFCTDNLPSVFRMKTEPWIDPDGADKNEIVEIVKKCPSGALSYSLKDKEYRDQDRNPQILVSKDGPYFVTGGIGLNDEQMGEGASKEHFALCRCGGSKNKPFCDGTHWYINFKDEKN